jgi:hypothetical protein
VLATSVVYVLFLPRWWLSNSYIQNLNASESWVWRILYSGIKYYVVRWKETDVSEEHVASRLELKSKPSLIFLHTGFLLTLFFRRHVPLKRRFISQKTASYYASSSTFCYFFPLLPTYSPPQYVLNIFSFAGCESPRYIPYEITDGIMVLHTLTIILLDTR